MANLTLLGACNDCWNQNAALAAAATLYNDEPPEGTAFPYAVVTNVSEAKERAAFDGGNYYRGTVQVVMLGLGTAVMEALAVQAAAAFEASGALTVAGRETLEVLPELYEVAIDFTRSTDARRVTEAKLRLEVWTHGP